MTYNRDNPNEHQQRSAYPGGSRNDRGAYPDQRGPDQRHDEDDDGPAIPEGDYPVKPVKHRWGWSSGKYPQIGISLQITDGEYKGRRLTWYATFSDAAAEWTIKGLRALGMVGDDAEQNIGTIYTSDALATAVVAHETYEGKTRAKVKFINGADIVMKEEMSPSELKAFSQRMKATFQRYGGGGGGAQQQRTSQSYGSGN